MATVTVGTTTTTLDTGASGFIRITNTGTQQATVVRGTDRTVLWPHCSTTITPNGVAVTATTPSGTTTLDTATGTLDAGMTGSGAVAGDDLSDDAIARLEAAFAPIIGSTIYVPQHRRGTFVALGDSITYNHANANSLAAAAGFPGGWTTSGANAGVVGDTTSDALARFDTAVAAKAPSVVHILLGTNDAGNSRSVATYAGVMRQIIAATFACGAAPVVGTIPPTSSVTPADRKAKVIAMNQWLCRYALSLGIKVADYYAVLVDTATGGLAAAYDSGDGVHPNSAGFAVMATELKAAMSRVPDQSLLLAKDSNDPWNWMRNGCFTAGTTGSVPTSWTQSGSPTGLTLSLAADAGVVQGRWFGIDAAASSGVGQFFQTQTTPSNSTPVTVGNRWMFGAKFSAPTLSAAQYITIAGKPTNSGYLQMNQNDIPVLAPTYLVAEAAVPATTTNFQGNVQLAAGTGSAKFGQVTIYDLTAMGVTDTAGALV